MAAGVPGVTPAIAAPPECLPRKPPAICTPRNAVSPMWMRAEAVPATTLVAIDSTFVIGIA